MFGCVFERDKYFSGTSIGLILHLDEKTSIIVSAAFAIFYTFVGGLYSVAYTDLVQLICIVLGMVRRRA